MINAKDVRLSDLIARSDSTFTLPDILDRTQEELAELISAISSYEGVNGSRHLMHPKGVEDVSFLNNIIEESYGAYFMLTQMEYSLLNKELCYFAYKENCISNHSFITFSEINLNLSNLIYSISHYRRGRIESCNLIPLLVLCMRSIGCIFLEIENAVKVKSDMSSVVKLSEIYDEQLNKWEAQLNKADNEAK